MTADRPVTSSGERPLFGATLSPEQIPAKVRNPPRADPRRTHQASDFRALAQHQASDFRALAQHQVSDFRALAQNE
jgi:hypothetical protein